MVHRFFMILLLLGAWGVALSAQPAPDVSDPTLLSLDLPEVVDGSVANLRQIGDFNEIVVEQINQQALAAQQQGNYNRLYAILEGGPNLVLAEQVGIGNYYELQLEGSNNELIIEQYGHNNFLYQDLKQAEYLYLQIEQHGNNNWIWHEEPNAGPMGLPGIPLKIEQHGDFLDLIISGPGDYPTGG